MRKFFIIGFMILLAFDTMAQIGFKMAAMQSAPAAFELAWIWRVITGGWVYCAVAGYIGAFITYMSILKHCPVGPAFAATHLEIVTVTIFSVLFLHEQLSPFQVVGGLLIVCGIALLATEKQADEHSEDGAQGKSTTAVSAAADTAPSKAHVDSRPEYTLTR